MLQCDADLEGLGKHQVSLVEFDQRNMVRSVVENVMKETLKQSSENFDKEAMANVLLKKVA